MNQKFEKNVLKFNKTETQNPKLKQRPMNSFINPFPHYYAS